MKFHGSEATFAKTTTAAASAQWAVEGRCSGAPADAAAAAASRSPPPPLPLPPGITFAQLPQLLRPTRRGRRSAEVAEGAAAAAAPKDAGEGAGKPGPRSVGAASSSSSAESKQLLQVCSALPERRAAAVFLWQSKSDSEIAGDIENTLANFDSLMDQCDNLFQECVTEAAAAGGEPQGPSPEQPRIKTEQLYNVTQRLIDALGSRDGPVLERIGHIYSAAACGIGGSGIGVVEFRGFVASVLTQVLRELQARSPEGEGGDGSEPEDNCPEQPDPSKADVQGSLFAALQGFFSSAVAGLADSPQPQDSGLDGCREGVVRNGAVSC